MSILHTFQVKNGTETKVITKAKAIRIHCLDCSGWQPGEIAKCTCHTCSLYPFRFGNEKGLDRAFYEEDRKGDEENEEDEWAKLTEEEED